MKNILYLISGFLFGHTFAGPFFDTLKLKELIEDRCQNSSIVTPDLTSVYTFYNFQHLSDNRNRTNFCENLRFVLSHSVETITKSLKPCFPNKKEHFIPKFINEGFLNTMTFLCGNRTFEIFYSSQGMNCLTALLDFQRDEIENCSRQMYTIFHKNVITKEDLCLTVESGERCYDETIVNACPYFEAFRGLNRDLLKAVRSVGVMCSSEVVNYAKGALVTICVLVSLRKFISVL